MSLNKSFAGENKNINMKRNNKFERDKPNESIKT